LEITTTKKSGITELFRSALLAIQYDETYTVADYLALHPEIDGMITKNIQSYTSTQQNFLTDGGIEYVHQLALTDKIMQVLLPIQQPVRYLVPMLCPCCGQKWPENMPIPDSLDLIPQQTDKTDYTGIVFDCRGYNLRPCLFPIIITDEGKEVYSVNFAATNSLIEWSLAQYTTNDDFTPPRAGRNPLVIQAIGTNGAHHTKIVITSADAQRIHRSKENVQLLKECRVVIIFGQ